MTIYGCLLHRNGDEESVSLSIDRLVNAGWTGRDRDAVDRHVAELEAEGVSPPDRTPILYPKPRHSLSTGTNIQVASGETSGEVEVAFYVAHDRVYVTVGSDHTDRELETENVALSKQVCPNVVGDTFWQLAEVADHWDELELRSWTGDPTDPDRYQTGTLAELRPPEDLFSLLEDRTTPPHDGTLLFSGSVGTDAGELRTEPYFEAELRDPVLNRTLSVAYTVDVIDWHTPEGT
ncbi:DUF2848 family protein [Halorarum halobium]|uniref:DUF2848 family protein n=1 Tax=Halorarum halobium TaxID=3075121 RepID=UPI0028ABBB4F|nr:DUF2848 family protein [Halobaculum sp. XH14]